MNFITIHSRNQHPSLRGLRALCEIINIKTTTKTKVSEPPHGPHNENSFKGIKIENKTKLYGPANIKYICHIDKCKFVKLAY